MLIPAIQFAAQLTQNQSEWNITVEESIARQRIRQQLSRAARVPRPNPHLINQLENRLRQLIDRRD